jgi:hypothetical protein
MVSSRAVDGMQRWSYFARKSEFSFNPAKSFHSGSAGSEIATMMPFGHEQQHDNFSGSSG